MIYAKVEENGILRVYESTVSDGVLFDTIRFTFPRRWDGYAKTVLFRSGETAVSVLLNAENGLCVGQDECYIPHEVLAAPSFTVSVSGVSGDRLATTGEAVVTVLQSGYGEGDPPADPTPDEYSQIIGIMTAAEQLAQSVRDDADAGAFRGEQGEKGDKGDTGEKGDKGDKGDPGADAVTDQTYGAASPNAQSGTAVAQAIATRQEKFAYVDKVNFIVRNDYYVSPPRMQDGVILQRFKVMVDENPGSADIASVGYVDESVEGFITKTVDDLTNYYLKSETYTKTEVQNLIAAISTMSMEVVQTLPTQNIKTNVIYLVPKASSQSQNVYNEYIYVNNVWEKIGDTQIDLSGYATKVSGAASGHLAGLDVTGNLTDSGKSPGDFVLKTDVTIYSGGDPDNITPSDLDLYIYYDTGGQYDWQTGDILVYKESLDDWVLYGRAMSDTKVTSLSSSSTDTQYPSAKCVYDLVGDVESALLLLRGGSAS